MMGRGVMGVGDCDARDQSCTRRMEFCRVVQQAPD